jgi:competence protein ComEC
LTPLAALAIAQVLGIALADRLAPAPYLVRLAAWTALALGVALRRRRVAGFACAALALAAASGAALAQRLADAARDRPAAPIEVTIDGTVTSQARGLGESEVELAGVAAVPGEPARVPPRAIVRARGSTPIDDALPGDRLRLRVRLRAPESRANPGGRDAARALARRGIGAVGALVHPALVVRLADAEGPRPLAPLHALRVRVAARLRAAGEGGALLAAFAVGDRGGLDLQRRTELRQLGLTHLLSVSGLHLVLVALGAFRLAGPLTRRVPIARDARRAALALAVGAATAYALLAGFEVPVQRSLVMLAAGAAGIGLRRPVRRAAPLAVAALAILAADPAALFDAGAQMSFLASVALVLALPVVPTTGLRRRVLELLHTSALATAATAPVAATLGSVSPWGLVANAVAVPWTGVALMPLAFAAAGASLAGTAGAPVVRAASAVAAASLRAASAAAERLPAAWNAQPAPVYVWIALAAALGLLLVRSVALRSAGAVAIVAALAAAPPPRVVPDAPRMVAIDVGQGDATLVQGLRGAVLVDGGGAFPGRGDLGASAVVPALRALGVERLDLVAASHGDLDHRGGLVSVLRAVPVGRLWLPYGGRADPAFAALVAVAGERRVPVEERGAGGAPLAAGDLTVESLWPPPGARGSRNDDSLVLRVAAGAHAVLLAGDLEAGAERALVASGAPLAADVLKLAHHGSRTSSTQAFLDAVGGAVAIASAPHFGRFGMPHADVVARAHGAGYAVWWTGRDGAVVISLGDPLWARGFRD